MEVLNEKEYVSMVVNGIWYTVEVDYDGQWDFWKARGRQELNELLNDLIHDCLIDRKFSLARQLQLFRDWKRL